ncbi:MAG: T9SS type A sorting domain-containing protein, partial [bacterium]
PGLNAKIDGLEGTHSTPDARSWTIDWVAPVTATDSVVFNFAGNAVNGDGGSSGDDPTVPARKAAYKQATSVDGSDESIVESFQLYQNYPNPFNSETRIDYQINTSGTVEFTIFDLQGRKIYGAIRNHASIGSFSFAWNGMTVDRASVASGVYTYQIKFNDMIQSRKLILLK